MRPSLSTDRKTLKPITLFRLTEVIGDIAFQWQHWLLLMVCECHPCTSHFNGGISTENVFAKYEETHMKNFAQKIKNFLASEDGPTAVEYAVMLALIIAVCIGSVKLVGQNTDSTFKSVGGSLTTP